MSNLQRMVVLSPELFEKLKSLQNSKENHLMLLDKELSNILNDKKINEDDKWYLYRQLLNQYCDKKRQISDSKNEATQTIPMESKQSQTITARCANKKSNTEIVPQIDQSTETDKIEQFFGNTELQHFNNDISMSDDENERRLSSSSAARKLIKKVNKKPLDPNKSYEIIEDGTGGYVTVSKNINDGSIEELNLTDGTTLSKKTKQSTPKKKK